MYSAHNRLISEAVQVRLKADHLEIWYGSKRVDVLPRLRGEGGHRIEYRHNIDWLVRKPGAFENYRYRQDLFPTHRFRVAYDQLKSRLNGHSSKAYLQIHELAVKENQALWQLINTETCIDVESIIGLLDCGTKLDTVKDMEIVQVELSTYYQLLSNERAGSW